MKIFIFLDAFLMTAVSSSSFASEVRHMYGPVNRGFERNCQYHHDRERCSSLNYLNF